ncbi:cytochrome b/b6 domain-containing protein [Grimontia sp. NTOU-MAR1]|uniref:cytochrome b/b6 domain-containing protein n=1 Tax=Grimontia sp. NTOU-MAR1 TaxID=3111011 RepID=UPI002DB66690|nr:cytochrome b/b6 domain-containing protein [Grimontia sp. NTOU-MAR1]WRV97741.1 cytochrome b/b6 domain-containing protein [Grimontia sp. NTOU-MAR1]
MKIWDAPTRIYHWLQAALFTAMCVTGFLQEGPHLTIGLALAALLVWRILWGLVGSKTSRFLHFVKSPRSAVNYLLGKEEHDGVGHNPAGGLMVILMLSLLMFQCFIGMAQAGYFDDYISDESWLYDIDLLAMIHLYGAYLLIGLVGIHLAAIAIYSAKGKSLVKAMITGRQSQLQPTSLFFRSNRRAGAILLGIGGFLTYFVSG